MKGFILDCSVAVCWCFKDRKTPATEELLDRGREEGIFVPALWHLELSNVLSGDERRKRISADQFAGILKFIAVLPIQTDEETTRLAWNDILAFARAEKLTTYDATYLELAIRKKLPLATMDDDLIKAAKRRGTVVLPG